MIYFDDHKMDDVQTIGIVILRFLKMGIMNFSPMTIVSEEEHRDFSGKDGFLKWAS